MDKKLRRLERNAATGDRDAVLRLRVYQCKLEGHTPHKLAKIEHYRDVAHVCWTFIFRMTDGCEFKQTVDDIGYVIRGCREERYSSLKERFLLAAEELDHCSRCLKPMSTGLGDIFLEELKKLVS